MGQMSKICFQALLFGQLLTSWHACYTGSTCAPFSLDAHLTDSFSSIWLPWKYCMNLRVAFLNKEIRNRQWNGRFDKNGIGRFSVIPAKSQVALDWPRSLGNWWVLCANSTGYQVGNTDTSTDISSTLEEISPLLLNSLDLKGSTTLVV